jgi:putative PIN family toxin of toxin-antitoxin system
VRIVLDTNVLVSGVLSAAGAPARILEAVLAGGLELAIDMAIREEYEEVLRRPELGFDGAHVAELLAAIDHLAHEVTAAPPCPEPLPDPDDEPFLGVAAASGSVLVTGNTRHYPARARRGVAVLTPRELVDRLRVRLG